METNEKSKTPLIIVLSVVLIIICCVVGWLLGKNFANKANKTDTNSDDDNTKSGEVVEDNSDNETKIVEINGVKVEYIANEVNTLDVSTKTEKLNLSGNEFVSAKNFTDRKLEDSFFSKKMINDIEETELFVQGNVIQFVISSSQFGRNTESDFTVLKLTNVGTPKVINTYYMASDEAMMYLYILNENNQVYRCSFDYHNGKVVNVTKLNINNVDGMTDILTEVNGADVSMDGTEYVIIKTKDNNYYKDYTHEGNKLVKLS